mmetsp:Transcript_32659/g.83242  ORF Transcript_32659/g.83242 Transcript_32659/m.83242 type:complete len:301 (+) Transcript_32659:293-1195(+)
MTRTGPLKRRLRTETGTRAPTPVVVASISATSWLSQLISKSKPIAVGPRSYARAARSCGGVPPVEKRRSSSLRRRMRMKSSSAISRSPSLSASAIISSRRSGATRFIMYCSVTSPGCPTAAEYRRNSCLIASKPSVAVRRASTSPSRTICSAPAQRDLLLPGTSHSSGSRHSLTPCTRATHVATSMVMVTFQQRLSTSAISRFARCTFFVPNALRSPSAAKMVVEKAVPKRNAPSSCQPVARVVASAPAEARRPENFCCAIDGRLPLNACWSALLSTPTNAMAGAGGRASTERARRALGA